MTFPEPERSWAEEVAHFFGSLGQFLVLVLIWFITLDEDEILHDREQ